MCLQSRTGTLAGMRGFYAFSGAAVKIFVEPVHRRYVSHGVTGGGVSTCLSCDILSRNSR
jgi:hypothetical protein